MDAFFLDPDVERLPPEQTRILDLRAEPYPDGRRVRVGLELTPFQKRPDIELTLTDPDGQPAASASIVEPMGWKLELTLHSAHRTPALPAPVPQAQVSEVEGPHPAPGTYTLTAILSYPGLGEVDRRAVSIEIPPAE
ncbi:MAG: hypothetical protein FD146_1069 [Anaerolineaceae bacterium]|nr:MAG: hypothetical protein FD146_1069 [Anaerolineaceae bacterium]